MLTLANVAPVASAVGPMPPGRRARAVTLNGSATDKGTNDTRTYKWTVDASGIDAGGTCTITNDTDPAATVTCNDDGTLKVSLVATDDDGGASTASVATITITNANPAISAFTKSDGSPLPTTLIVAGTLGLKAAFTDAGSQRHTIRSKWTAARAPSRLRTAATSPATSSCNFPTIGPITIRIKVADDDGGYHVLSHTMTVKYDFAGFYAPVDRPNTMNVSKAGQAIPLKWTLRDATGAPVTNLATVTIKAVSMACALGATADQMEEYASGSFRAPEPRRGQVPVQLEDAYDVRRELQEHRAGLRGWWGELHRGAARLLQLQEVTLCHPERSEGGITRSCPLRLAQGDNVFPVGIR